MLSVKKILDNPEGLDATVVEFCCWVVGYRTSQQVNFVVVNDGSSFKSLQVVVKEELARIQLGSAVFVRGVVKYTPEAQQVCEIQAEVIDVLAKSDKDYLVQKNEISLEILRENLEYRHRTQLFRAIMRIRSRLALEIHSYFDSLGYLCLHSPILTSNDGEGAGETFSVNTPKGNFFGEAKNVFLTVTGQLHAESYALGFGGVYTFGPTFRAELSHTPRHAAEFWMVEPEVAFFDLKQIIELAESLLKTVITKTIKACEDEMQFLESKKPGIIERLEKFLNSPLKVVEYREAVKILQQHSEQFEVSDVRFGTDFTTEHEKFLVSYIGGPIAVVNFPKKIKAFYMLQNSDNETVASFDLLVPDVGELVGGSQRESDLTKLVENAKRVGCDLESLQWYLDLRRFGYASSSGFGLGFERLVMYVTGIENIRDVLPYPRTAGNIKK